MADNAPPVAPPASGPATTGRDQVPETTDAIFAGLKSKTGPIWQYGEAVVETVRDQFFSTSGLSQLLIILVIGSLAWIASKSLVGWGQRSLVKDKPAAVKARYQALLRLVFPLLCVLGLWLVNAAFRQHGSPNDLLRLAASLLNAWIFVRLVSGLFSNEAWSRAFAVFAWTVAALFILRLLNPTIALLDGMAMKVGTTNISLYMIIKGAVLVFLYVGIANAASRLIGESMGRKRNVNSSATNLIAQGARVLLLIAAVFLALHAVGVDLTTLAVFSGAVGIGIGFGLQAISSNLVAGVIMLLERSVRVGDFIDMQSGVTGEVREINIRSTRVTTNDNIDVLIPNAEFINGRVTNWTLRDAYRRIRVPFGVAYGTDKNRVREAALEAAKEVPHMLEGETRREPQVWLVGFGESSLDFELVVWLKPDAVKRPSAVQAEYNWAIESALKRHGIEIPFPQRDLHLKSGFCAVPGD